MRISDELQEFSGYPVFEDLEEGDVFLYRDDPGRIYMKIDMITTGSNETRNAVLLSNGKTLFLFDDEPVLPLKVVLELA